jgi:hypothetical protein
MQFYGHHNLEKTLSTNTLETTTAVWFAIGKHASNFVNWSIIINDDLLPFFETGNGPKMAMWILSSVILMQF